MRDKERKMISKLKQAQENAALLTTFNEVDMSNIMEIRKDNAAARKSFRARHKCDTASDKTSARYWSCKMW